MWFIRAVLLVYVLQIQIPGLNSKPQASVGSDSTLCQYLGQDRCNEPSIIKDCPNMCRPVEDPALCNFFTTDHCKEPNIKAQCPSTCKPVSGCGSYESVFEIPSVFDRIKDASGDSKHSSLLKNIGGMAALYNSKTDLGPHTHICGASLISDEFLLTAAHCVVDRQPRSISITVGREDLNDKSVGNQYEIQNIYINPAYKSEVNDRIRINYKANDYGDIALLKTNQRVQFTNKIWPFCLPENNQKLDDYQFVRIAGWGQVNKSSKASVIQSTQVQIVENSRCESLWLREAPYLYNNTKKISYPQGLTKQILCAGRDGVDACRGDSGGPLSFQNTKGVNIIMGIIAKGINCPLYPILPGYYTNVAYYVEWILETIKNSQLSPKVSPIPDKCTDGQSWKQDCNDCICVNEQKICTTRTCKEATTTSQPTYSGIDLWNAARDGNLAKVNSILATGVNPDWQNEGYSRYTSLHIASENNQPAIMRVLLDAGATKDMRDKNGFTSVFHASNHGHIDALSTLIDYGANVDLGNNDNYTPLMQSTGKGFLNIVETLTDAQAKVNQANNRGMTALHEAALYNRIEIARLLFWKGADISKKGNKGETPSDKARRQGYHQLQKILQGFAGNTDVQNTRPQTFDERTVNQINKELDLWNAAREGNLASVKIGIDKGINPNWKNQNHYGYTALHIAALNNHPLIMTVLLDAGAKKDVQDNSGFTPIFAASGRGSKYAVLTLIEYGADVDIATNSGYTPLMQATGKGYTAIVEALLEANANVKITNKGGETAFFGAASYNRLNIAQLLLRKGADPRKTDNDGRTPADHARDRGYSDLADIIDRLIGVIGK